MLESIFSELAREYHGKFNIMKENVMGKGFSRLPITKYCLSFHHDEVLINLKYEFGNHNLAEIRFKLDSYQQIPNINISTTDNILRLLSFRKKIWKIKSESKKDSILYLQALNKSGLTKMADISLFEPTISGQRKENTYEFSTIYSLAFKDKEHSIEPIIDFHKRVINFLIENHRKT